MSRQINMGAGASGTFIRACAPDDEAIGGKARSLGRLAALGLPVPAAFAVSTALYRAMAPAAPPARLRASADLLALDAARAALESAAFPAGFEDQLAAALDALGSGDKGDLAKDEFAVRSSAALEDRAEETAAGVYLSLLPVPRAAVADAVRRVLASSLTPAAWVYGGRATVERDPRRGPGADGMERDPPAVLIHPFIAGTAAGSVAFAPPAGPDPAGASAEPTRGAPGGPLVDVTWGALTPAARAAIEAAARTAAARFGGVELEWTARADVVTFLQLRPFRAGRSLARSAAPVAAPVAPDDDGWLWDAAHNPLPLSPAQAGLVALVDERCRIGIRQRVIDGYLFLRPAPPSAPAPTPAAAAASPRAAFARLAAETADRLTALGPAPALEATLELFVAAYQPLFGVIQPACAAARAALKDFLARALPDGDAASRELSMALLAGAAPIVTRRRALVRAIAEATEAGRREAALAAYLAAFGDESPRWDVAEPTWREVPERLLLLGVVAPGRSFASPPDDGGAGAREALRQRLPPALKPQLDRLLGAAREAVAVGEEDDALFARLQAAVRYALSALGRRLADGGRLAVPDDVFFLPLALARDLAAERSRDSLDVSTTATADLEAIVAAEQRAFRAAAADPPRPTSTSPRAGSTAPARLVRGLSGARGATVGRAVHHPASSPPRADDVLIAATLLPTELPLLSPAAIVVETGSVLGHVAAQARERGIPAVVGAAGARRAIRDGALIAVDGDRGEVTLLDEG